MTGMIARAVFAMPFQVLLPNNRSPAAQPAETPPLASAIFKTRAMHLAHALIA